MSAESRNASVSRTNRSLSTSPHSRQTDERLAAEVREILVDVRRLRSGHYLVACRAGVVTLHGRVSSYYAKQVAQEVVRAVHGVRRIVNEIHVESSFHRFPKRD